MKRVVCIFLSVIFLTGCSRIEKGGEYSRTVPLMDTFVQVKVIAPGFSQSAIAKAVGEALEKARKLEKKFSAFDPASEVNALNIAGTQETSPELFDLVKKATRISRITDGEFDITVAPILKADGFYRNMPAEIRNKIPKTFSGVGWRNVTLGSGTNRVTLSKGAWIDLSGIAKGYIVDQMSELLRKKGITAFLINAGGDIYCTAKGKDGTWKIGIRKPGTRDIVIALAIKDMAVATSGDYENVVIDKTTGETMSHIINPFLDKPREEAPSSITVIAPSCSKADALATGMMAMGKDKAIMLADTLRDIEIIAVECPASKQTVTFSKGAAKYVIGR